MNLAGKQSTFDPKGPLAQQQIDAFYVTLWVTGFLLFAVGGTYLVAVIKFRLKKGDDPNEIPHQSHGHPLIEVGLVAVSAGLLVIIAIPTFAGIALMKNLPDEWEGKEAIEINVVGYQWWFNFEYADEGIYSSNELVIPAGRPVHLNLITRDVLHSFWIPKLSGKTDLMAGQVNEMWILADEPGYFWGQCAEYCGDSHAYMLFRTVALSDEDYAEWLAQQKTKTVQNGIEPVHIPAGVDPAQVAAGAALFQKNCLSCHLLDPAQMNMGAPNLAHFASRSSIAAGWLENDWTDGEGNAHLFKWIKEPEAVKPGNYMWSGFLQEDGTSVLMEGLADKEPMTDDEVHAILAYLQTLKHPEAKQFGPAMNSSSL